MKSKKSKTNAKIEEAGASIFYEDVLGIWNEHKQKKKGIHNFKETAAGMLASNTEYKLRRVIQEGLKFAMHSKHPGTLTPEDIRSALKVECEEPVYGHLPILGDNGEDKVVRLADLKAPPRPGLITVGRHWLAIEGVQPIVPQNPSVEEIYAVSPNAMPPGVQVRQDASRAMGQMSEPPAKVQKTEGVAVMNVLTEEMSLLYEKVCASITDGGRFDEEVVKSLFASSGAQQILPYILQFIFNEVKRGGLHDTTERCKIVALLGKIVCPEANLITTMMFIPSSSSSSGPYSSSSTAGQAPHSHFNIEAYLLQFMQIAITCVTTKDTREERKDARCPALAARKDAGQILCSLCNRGYTYEGQSVSKVITSLAHVAENGAKPPLSRFGAITALSLLGSNAFNECGLNGTREVAFACSEDKEICVDVKAMVLNELYDCVKKSLKDLDNYFPKSSTKAADEEKKKKRQELQTRLQELGEFICWDIEDIKAEDRS